MCYGRLEIGEKKRNKSNNRTNPRLHHLELACKLASPPKCVRHHHQRKKTWEKTFSTH